MGVLGFRCHYEALLAKQSHVLGEDHRQTIGTRIKIANLIADWGKADEAVSMSRQVLDEKRSVLGDDHKTIRKAEDSLAKLQQKQ